MRHRIGLAIWLTVVWIGLWGNVSWGNVVGGLAASALLVALFAPLESVEMRIRPISTLRFLAHFGVSLVRASLEVSLTVIRPHPNLRKAVIAVPLGSTTRGVTLVIAASISLTPGTLVIDTRNDGGETTLYVHVLDMADRAKTIADVARIQQLATAAFAPAPSTTASER